MIASFGDRATEAPYHGHSSRVVRRIPNQIWGVARRKLDMIEFAHVLDDLLVPPGNRLEALRGDLTGFHSIRINAQWRVVFRWRNGAVHDVEVVDYH